MEYKMGIDNHRIVFRADGNSIIGLGHVMRLLGLYEHLKDNFDCVFLINNPTVDVKNIIESYCPIIILDTLISNEYKVLDQLLNSSDIVVLDGYCFDENYQKYIKSKVHKLVMIDDNATIHFYADLVINHGSIFSKDNYLKESYTKILTGIDYLILRKEFLETAPIQRNINIIDSVFICMGGADPFNITLKALEASINCDFVKNIVIITGNAYSNVIELNKLIINSTLSKKIIHETNVTASRLIELMNICELAICPASSIALEACCVKIGLLTGVVINNQDSIHDFLVNTGCCISLGDLNLISSEEITLNLNKMNNVKIVKALMSNQKKAIDGCSGKRILNEFKLLCE